MNETYYLTKQTQVQPRASWNCCPHCDRPAMTWLDRLSIYPGHAFTCPSCHEAFGISRNHFFVAIGCLCICIYATEITLSYFYQMHSTWTRIAIALAWTLIAFRTVPLRKIEKE